MSFVSGGPMTAKFHSIGILGLLAASIVLAGCHAPDHKGEDPLSDTPPAFTYVARDYSFQRPSELPAGWVRLDLEFQGREPHHLQLFRLTGDHTTEDLVEALAGNHSIPDFAISVGGPNYASGGGMSSAYVLLEEGEHALLCVIPDREGVPHFVHGMAMTVTVTDEGNDAEPAAATLDVSLDDFRFEKGAWAAGEHIVRARNIGMQHHEAVVLRYHEGGNFSEVLRAFSPEGTGPPPADFVAGTSGFDAGAEIRFVLRLEPGEYALVCFLEDSATNLPHFALGMQQDFTVS
jgi:hypothetical protein